MCFNGEFQSFVSRLSTFIEGSMAEAVALLGQSIGSCPSTEDQFGRLALELFSLQFNHNPAYRKICTARQITPKDIGHWSEIPSAPTSAYKEFELSCLAPEERTAVFYSSGTTEHRPSRHFHNSESLAIYEKLLLYWFDVHMLNRAGSAAAKRNSTSGACRNDEARRSLRTIILTPPKATAPHSSLVHMFETVVRSHSSGSAKFVGVVAGDGSWKLDLSATIECFREAISIGEPVMLLGTAFSFVHLLDNLIEHGLQLTLSPGSRALETGGYKGRSRSVPKAELHSLITERLGILRGFIVSEYGMAELSSQAYDCQLPPLVTPDRTSRRFHFPPWARVQVISPETGREVAEGETGFIRIFDLANVYSVVGVQTEDLGIQCGDGFELVGRARYAESRGCSLVVMA
jgi:hypothetical protein